MKNTSKQPGKTPKHVLPNCEKQHDLIKKTFHLLLSYKIITRKFLTKRAYMSKNEYGQKNQKIKGRGKSNNSTNITTKCLGIITDIMIILFMLSQIYLLGSTHNFKSYSQ